MKQVTILMIVFLFFFASNSFAVTEKKKKIVMPPECRTAKFTCILKYDDGEPYFCQKTVKQRYRNATKPYRVVKERKCTKRFAVEYREIKADPLK